MARRRYRKEVSILDIALELAGACLAVYGMYIFSLYKTNPEQFWDDVNIGIGIIVVFIVALLSVEFLRRLRWKRIVNQVESTTLKADFQNLINRFGKEKTKENWTYRTYVFDQQRLEDFLGIIRDKGLLINEADVKRLLIRFIDEEEYQLTKESVVTKTHQLNELTGDEFEALLRRLFIAMGYRVQMIGGVGDQGGDLIAVYDGKRYLVQAKRYKGSVGNSAVQQAFTAKPHYDCDEALVVTSGSFTKEAKALAKTSRVQLVAKEELQRNLMKYLRESWA